MHKLLWIYFLVNMNNLMIIVTYSFTSHNKMVEETPVPGDP
jgi:hypothetical protein